MANQSSFFDPDEKFDLFDFMPELVKLSELEGKTILILDYVTTDTQYKEALKVQALVIEDASSFDNEPVEVLISSTVLKQRIEALENPHLKCLTISKQTPKQGGQPYYVPIPTPEKLLKLIHKYRVNWYITHQSEDTQDTGE